jgi:hypothetical protein
VVVLVFLLLDLRLLEGKLVFEIGDGLCKVLEIMLELEQDCIGLSRLACHDLNLYQELFHLF